MNKKVLSMEPRKSWTQPVFVKTAQELISRMDDKRSKVFNTHQGNFGSQWLNIVPCKKIGLILDDPQHQVSIGLRLGVVNICVAQTCLCGKRIERDELDSLSCIKGAGLFSRHATLNSLIKSLWDLSTCLQCSSRGLFRTDGKRPDGVTMIP